MTLFEQVRAAGGNVVDGRRSTSLYFQSKPSRELLDQIKAAGFRWNSRSMCWNRSAYQTVQYDELGHEIDY